jgi:hypothetical protein
MFVDALHEIRHAAISMRTEYNMVSVCRCRYDLVRRYAIIVRMLRWHLNSVITKYSL